MGDVEGGDRRAAWAALVSAALMIAQQVGGKATRDALFLSNFEASDLPRVVIAAAAVSMVAVLITTRAFERFGPARVVPLAFGLSALLFFTEWGLIDLYPKTVSVLLYLHTATFGALVISGFWSVVNERFDPHAAKRVISRIGAGATFGGVAGGLLAERVGSMWQAEHMLLFLGGLSLLAGLGISRIGGAEGQPVKSVRSHPTGGLRLLARTPYLRALGSLVFLTAVSAALLDYAFKAQAAATFDRGSSQLLTFFALFHTISGVVSLGLQVGVARPALARLGVGGTVGVLPTLVLLTASVGAAMTGLVSLVIARATELVLANSIFRSGYELLFTPISAETKRPTKTLIDVAGNRIGDAAGSLLVLGILALWGDDALATVMVVAALVAAANLVLARGLNRGYVGQLRRSLLRDEGTGKQALRMQAATLQTLSTLGLDREQLFEQLAQVRNAESLDTPAELTPERKPTRGWSALARALRGGASAPPRALQKVAGLPYLSLDTEDKSGDRSWSGATSTPPGPVRQSDRPQSERAIPAPDQDSGRGARLQDEDAAVAREALLEAPLTRELVPIAIGLLARRETYPVAIDALRAVAIEEVDLLGAALRDPNQAFAIRRRIPRALELCDTSEAVESLRAGLADPRFEVRYRCALAMSRIIARQSSLAPDRDGVHAVVAWELETSRRVWESRRLLDKDIDVSTPLLEGALRDRIHRSLEHVFTLLSLSYEQEPLKMALTALSGEARGPRGTALEYLENILPESICKALFPMLDDRLKPHPKRSRQALVAELSRSMLAINAEELKSAIEARRGEKSSGE